MSQSITQRRVRTGRILHVKRAVQDLINIFKDNWFYIIEHELIHQLTYETFQKYRFLITQEINLLKRVVSDTSLVYKDPAERKAVVPSSSLETESTTDENYDLSQKDTNKQFAMQAINKYTNLTNHSLLKVTYRNQKLDYDVINFNNAEIFTDAEDWMRIIAVKHFFGLNVNEGHDNFISHDAKSHHPIFKFNENEEGVIDGAVQEFSMAKLWVIEDVPRLGIIEDGSDDVIEGGFIYTIEHTGDLERITKKEPIPYKDKEGKPILPFVLFSKEYPVDNLLDFTTGNDLRDLNINVAILMVYLNTVEKYQSFKQVVMNTDDPESIPNDISISPSEILINPTKEGGGSVQVLDLQADTKIKFDLIKERIMTTLSTYNISPENFTMSASPQSGFALKISNIGKIESREAQVPMYRVREKEVFEKERIIWNHHQPTKKINENAELMIDFAELDFPKSPDEKAAEFTFLKSHNAKTEIDLIMSLNPDLTEEQAKDRWEENKAFNQASQPQFGLTPPEQPADGEGDGEEETEEEG